METIQSESRKEFAVNANFGKVFGWSLLLFLGLAFILIAVFGTHPVAQLLAGAFAVVLIAVSSRMLWPIFSLAGIRLDGMTLLVLKKRADPISFNLPADVKEVSRFGVAAGNEMLVVLNTRGTTFRLVTSQYHDAERLRQLLAERLKLGSS